MKRLPRDQQKKLQDDAKLAKVWRHWHQEQLDEALAGPDGYVVSEIMSLLSKVGTVPASTLVAKVRSLDWGPVTYAARLVLLHEVNQAVTAVRETRGLDPIDDGFDHEPDGVFRLVKQAAFREERPHSRGAHNDG